ncbi:protein of unknown function [Lactiplantibacillus plantarum]
MYDNSVVPYESQTVGLHDSVLRETDFFLAGSNPMVSSLGGNIFEVYRTRLIR